MHRRVHDLVVVVKHPSCVVTHMRDIVAAVHGWPAVRDEAHELVRRGRARAEALRRCGLGGVVVAGVVWVVKQPCDGRFDVAVQPEGLAGLCMRKAHVLEHLEWCRTLIDAGAMLEEPMSAGLQVAPGGVPRLLHLRVGEPETR